MQLPIFCRPLLILRIKDLWQATPADKAHQRLLLFRVASFTPPACSCCNRRMAHIVRVFAFCAADAETVFRRYAVVGRFSSTPQLSRISQSDIPRRLACRAVSLHSTLCSLFLC